LIAFHPVKPERKVADFTASITIGDAMLMPNDLDDQTDQILAL
jgi:hypothetical protein